MESMEQRRNAIEDLINKEGNISFAQIKKAFPHVSDMTLRTDLKALDEARRIIRVHGGAKSVHLVVGTDDYLNKRAGRNSLEKHVIAEKALGILEKNATIFLDSGSTTTALARIIPDEPCQIYTTGLSCAIELTQLEKAEVFLPGGKLNRYSMSLCGFQGMKELENVNFNQAYMGVTCYAEDTGFTCASFEEAMLKRTAMQQAEQVILLMDSSKVGKRNPFTICHLDLVDLIISDGRLPEEFVESCRLQGVEIL